MILHVIIIIEKKHFFKFSDIALQIEQIYRKHLYFIGPNACNGKSTLLKVLYQICQSKNVSHITMHKLEERFAAQRVLDKLVNAVSEIERKKIDRMETFKAIVTGDEGDFEKKGKDFFGAKPFCKMIFATNYLPEFDFIEDDRSIYRRFHIIRFDKVFSQEEISKFDEKKILTQEAIDYLANISLREYLKIKDNHKLANDEESNKELNQCKKNNNSIEVFLNDKEAMEDAFASSNKVPRNVFYGKYCGWCKERKLFCKNKNVFYQEVDQKPNFRECKLNGDDCFENLSVSKDGLKEKPSTF